MKFRNKKKFRYGIPAYTGPFRALVIITTSAVVPGAFTVVQRFSDCGPPGAQLFL